MGLTKYAENPPAIEELRHAKTQFIVKHTEDDSFIAIKKYEEDVKKTNHSILKRLEMYECWKL